MEKYLPDKGEPVPQGGSALLSEAKLGGFMKKFFANNQKKSHKARNISLYL